MAHRARTSPVFGDLRPSQIITTFGPGSVVDLQNVSVIVGGTDFWVTQRDQQIDEPRLLSMLRVRHLYRPAVRSDGGAAGVGAGVSQCDGDAGNHRPGRVADMSQDGTAGLRQQRGTCPERYT